MQNIRHLLFVTSLLTSLFLQAQTGTEVTITPLVSPPYSPYVEDYLKLTNGILMLQNNTASQIQLKLIGGIFGDNGLYAKTKDNYMPSSPIVLSAFETRNIMANDQALNFLDPNNIETNVSKRQQNRIIRSGVLPEGNYSYCVHAEDYNTGLPQSLQRPAGCSRFNISYPQPPQFVQPHCGTTTGDEFPIFTWTPPIGYIVGANIRYDLYIVQMPVRGINDPNDVMERAVEYKAGNPLVLKDLIGPFYQYLPSDPPLLHNHTYAFMVIAKDLNEEVVFENEGKSEVCTFRYSSTLPTFPGNSFLISMPASPCGCETAINDANAIASPTVAAGAVLKVGSFDLSILSISSPPDGQGKFSGEGTIPVPFLNSQFVKIRAEFMNAQVNSVGQVVAGTVQAKTRPDAAGASFMPTANPPNWDGLSLNPGQATDIGNYFEQTTGQVINAATQVFNSLGFEMPLGVETGGVIIAVTAMKFAPNYSTFDAVAAIKLDNPDVIALGAKDVCLTKDDLCGEAKLVLGQDMNINLFSAGTMTLVGYSPPQDSGCYVNFDKNGFKNFRIKLEYAFPMTMLKPAPGKMGPVKASITASAASWDNWIGAVAMDDFVISGAEEFTFKPGGGWYDHSAAKNPPNMPALYAEMNNTTWEGFYYSSLGADLPPVLNNNGTPINVGITNLVIDDIGVSVTVNANNILSIGSGKIGDWGYSLDNINVQFLKNQFKQGGFHGKILLPITTQNQQSYLNYNCVLSLTSNKFNYQFSITPQSDLEIPLWVAEMTLFQTSNIMVSNMGGSFNASATLNGKLSIVATIPVIEVPIDFDLMTFQGLTVSTAEPYFTLGDFNLGFASPQKEFAGFSVGLSDVELVSNTMNPGVGLQFALSLNLSDSPGLALAAETTLTFYGKFTGDGPAFDRAEVNKIVLDADLSVFHFEGVIDFYYADDVFGNGFRGAIKVEIVEMITVDVTLQMGATTYQASSKYKYWYFDGLVILPTGIQLFSGIEAFGFGGGAYYHMSQNYTPLTMSSNGDNMNPMPGASPSGISYLPNKNVALGLKATIYIGLTGAREAFNADVTFSLEFASGGGLNKIALDGNARMISDNSYQNGIVNLTMHAEYDNAQQIFLMEAFAEADLGIIAAQGSFGLYFDGAGQWYIKFGRPEPYGSPLSVEFLGFDVFKSYFEVGNYDIDPMPGPPAWVVEILNKAQNKNAQTDWQSASDRPGFVNGDYSFKMIHGSSTGFGFEGSFLIFYAKLNAGMGYDVTLVKANTGCDGNPASASQVGLNGWYAVGQAYAGIAAEFGIEVDLGFVSGSFSIFEAGAAAFLEAGLVDPTWVHGMVGAYFSILDGLVDGELYFEFSLGDQCLPGTGDPLEGVKLISDLHPQPNTSGVNTKEQEISIAPAVATTLVMDSSHEIQLDERETGSTVTKHRLFRFHEGLVEAALKNTSTNQWVTLEASQDEDPYGIAYQPKKGQDYVYLDKKKNYLFTVTAKIEECSQVVKSGAYYECTGSWAPAKDKNNAVFTETKSVKFKTNAGLDSIPAKDVVYTLPYQMERYFCHRGYPPFHKSNDPLARPISQPAMVKMKKLFNPDNFNIPPENLNPADYNVSFKARWVPLTTGSEQAQTVDLHYQDDSLYFDYPGALLPNTYYAAQIIGEWKSIHPDPKANWPVATSAITKVLKVHNTIILAQMTGREIIQAKLAVGGNQKKLYEVIFKTSQYPDLEAKLHAMNTWKAVYTVVPQLKNIPVTGSNLSTAQSILKTIAAAIPPPPGLKSPVFKIKYVPEIWLRGNERFDRFDILGFPGKLANNAPHNVPPYVKFKRPEVSGFFDELMQELYDILPSSSLEPHVQIIANGLQIIDNFTTSIDAPYDPPLTMGEVFGTGGGGSGGGSSGGSSIASLYQQFGPLNMSGITSNSSSSGMSMPSWWSGVIGTALTPSNIVLKYYTIWSQTTGYGGGGLNGFMGFENQLLGSLYSQTSWQSNPTSAGFTQLGIAYDHLNTSLQSANLISPVVNVSGGFGGAGIFIGN